MPRCRSATCFQFRLWSFSLHLFSFVILKQRESRTDR